MSDTRCAHIGCARPSHHFWRLCDEHDPEYSDSLARIMRASTPTPEPHVFRGPAPPTGDIVTVAHMPSQPSRETHTVPGYPLGFVARGALEAYGDVPSRLDYSLARVAKPKPATLREWLGDRVSELGRWADVLHEQPVPAGQVTAWEWFLSESLHPAVWMLRASEKDGSQQVFGPRDMVDFVTRWDDFFGDCLRESLQMALFTRHPDVQPDPPRAAFPWDPYPEVV